MVAPSVDASNFDPFNPDHQPVHHRMMAEFRGSCPVARLASGLPVVSRFDDVRSALNDPRLRNSHAGRAPGVYVPPEDRFFFFEYDQPEHVPMRRVLLDLLSRGRAAEDAPDTRDLCDELLAPLVAAGGGELVNGLSIPFGGRLMMRVAGLPEEDAPQWRAWIKDMVTSGFSFTNTKAGGTGFAECYPDVLEYLDAHIDARATSADRPPDVLSRVVTADIDGEPLSRTIQRMMVFSVVSAGTNTLVNFLSNTFWSLARLPDVYAALRADRSLVPTAVEESLRRDSPSMYLTRICAEDVEIAGTELAAGERVLLGLASANRDERAYPEAERFLLDRDGQPMHVAFGWGAHLCIGAPVARQAGVTVLETLVDRVAALEVEPGTTPMPYLSPQGNGLDELYLRLTPA